MGLRKTFFCLGILVSFAALSQEKDTAFQKEWADIDSLVLQGNLSRSALEKTDLIYQKAKQRNLPAQVIKAVYYRSSLQQRIMDNDPGAYISSTKKEIAVTDDPVQRSILYSFVAKQYLQFYNQRRWTLLNRKTVTGVVKNDINTWSADDLLGAIRENFLLSLKDAVELQRYPVRVYDAIIIKGNKAKTLGLFDILVLEALEYFKSDNYTVTKPADLFTINDENALASMDVFIKSPIVTTDSSASQWIALELFRQLLSFHKNDSDKSLLVKLDLDRIQWVNDHSLITGKTRKYEAALTEITEKYSSVSSSAEAWYLLAMIDVLKAQQYMSFKDTTGRYGYTMAEAIIEKALSLYPSGETGDLQNLLRDIRQKSLNTTTEQVNIPDKPFRALVTFHNIDLIFGRIIKKTAGFDLSDHSFDTTYWKKIVALKPYHSFQQTLPSTNDHRVHSTEIKIDALPVGEYLLITSNGSSFNPLKDNMSAQLIHVSNISYIKNGTDFFVLNRDNGAPIARANISIYRIEPGNRGLPIKFMEKTTNEKGGFSFTEDIGTSSYRYEITKGKDRLFLQQNDYMIYNNQPDLDDEETRTKKYEAANSRILFFTDRAIYRPGQTVLFKGIGYTRDRKTKQNKLLISKDPAWVFLNDANHKKIDSSRFVFNSFGSFSGSFHIPQNLLTGNFSISVPKYNNFSKGFSVEEYKRHSFVAAFEKSKGAYRLNDSVIIKGNAKGYAGNTIDGGKVVYNVKRNTRYQYPWLGTPRYPAEYDRPVSNGQTTTDANGNFIIRFKALAEDIDTAGVDPLFDFTVTADITDNNGETRSASTRITAGAKSLLLHLTAPVVAETDSFKQVTVYTTNLNNEKVPAVVRLKIYALQAPDHPIRKRLWARPDVFVMNRQEFSAAFPTDEFENESDYHTWNTGKLEWEATVDTKDSEIHAIPDNILRAGYYKINAATVDRYGQSVQNEWIMQLFDRNGLQNNLSSFDFTYDIKSMAEPGETASFISASAAPRLYVIRKTEKAFNNTEGYEYIERNNKKPAFIQYTPTENDRGGVFINEAYVYDNRLYTHQYVINVPWTNKMLDIKYASFRDKTEPGNPEKWTVTVQTKQSEKAAAELLTGMYDASLDQFRKQNWILPSIWPRTPSTVYFMPANNFTTASGRANYLPQIRVPVKYTRYDQFIFAGDENVIGNVLQGSMQGIQIRGQSMDEVVTIGYGRKNLSLNAVAEAPMAKAVPGKESQLPGNSDDNPLQPVRTNFSETAFFFPQLYADSLGQYTFSFTMPDALTQWKWMSIAHTKDLAFGASSATIITQKKMMVQSNAPRFMREGDNMEFSARISNLDEKELTGQVSFELFDPATNTSVDGWFQNVFPSQYFTVAAGQSFSVRFPIQIPFNYNRPLGWRVVARSGSMSDGEENVLPVLTNRVLITESMPMFLQNDTTKQYSFDRLLKNKSESLTNESLTVEYTTNPVWYAVKSLPYLIEFPYECAEQTFNRFYANTLASYIVNKQPVIRKVFEEWKKDTTSLHSNLQKNEDLKQVILQETPWVMQAENEAAQRKDLAMLFDMASLNTANESFIAKLQQQQLPNGGFAWFKGGSEDRYITNYILTGIGKLKRLGALTPDLAMRIRTMLGNAVKYMDDRIINDYTSLLKSKSDTTLQYVGTAQIEYMYMRSFFNDIALNDQTAWQYYYRQAKKYWIKLNTYSQAQIGLVVFRDKDEKFAIKTILPSLLENTVIDSKQGMYWKNAYTNWWYQSPVEHQSMMIAFMSETGKNQKGESLKTQLNAMRTWLLLNKQTNNWKTTVATADACYALLLNGSDWFGANRTVTIQLGNYTVSSSTEKTETGSGYLKKRIEGRLVKPEMGNISVSTVTVKGSGDKQDAQPSWGSVYWQYFENMDNITGAGGPLSIVKKLFIEKNTNKGKQLNAVKDGEELKVGDKLIVRMELRSERDMDYLHLKDTRAAGTEPVNVLSGYRWQDGLGYYESTKDASSNFFIDHLKKGTYVFEYPLFVSHIGIFSAGIATIQCMYAPEFTAHSEGLKIRVGE